MNQQRWAKKNSFLVNSPPVSKNLITPDSPEIKVCMKGNKNRAFPLVV